MSPKLKDRLINGLIAMSSGIIVAVVAFSMDSHNADAKENDEELDGKLDRTEYVEDQNKRWKAHDEVQAKTDEKINDTYSMVKFLYEEEIKKSKR